MAFDEGLADRTRAALGDVQGVTEIKMFGGLCFTVHGNMAVGVTGSELMVRLAPDDGEAALAEPGVRPMDFTGKPMKGFIYVAPEGVKTDSKLKDWVSQGVASASSLPPRSSATRSKARSKKQSMEPVCEFGSVSLTCALIVARLKDVVEAGGEPNPALT